MEDIDVWRSAAQFIKMHGEDAGTAAALRADECLESGDPEGFRVWQRIVGAIRELQKAVPDPGNQFN